MTYHKSTIAEFRPLDHAVATALVDFASRRNIGKSIEIEGRDYTLEYISQSSSSYFRGRGISIYFRTGRSIVRISDHWSATRHHPRSRKFNCGYVSSCRWSLKDRPGDVFETSRLGGSKYPHRMLAGICGLTGFVKAAA